MIALRVNGRHRGFEGPPFKRLIDVLREDFALTGTKEGCGEGECGACTVLVDGAPVNSCLIPVCQVEGRRVETIEGLGKPESLNPLQRAFLREGGAQCGICTPGMLMTAWAYVKAAGAADPEAIREQLAGNLCRCTGYQDIVDSVIAVVRARRRPAAIARKRATGGKRAPFKRARRATAKVRRPRRGPKRAAPPRSAAQQRAAPKRSRAMRRHPAKRR